MTDEETTVAGTGVLRGGNTSALLGWQNHAGDGDITLSKDSSDVIRFGGAGARLQVALQAHQGVLPCGL